MIFKELKNIENEKIENINELRAIYIQELINQRPEALSIKLNSVEYKFKNLVNDEAFELLKTQTKLKYTYLSNYNGHLFQKSENTIDFSKKQKQ